MFIVRTNDQEEGERLGWEGFAERRVGKDSLLCAEPFVQQGVYYLISASTRPKARPRLQVGLGRWQDVHQSGTAPYRTAPGSIVLHCQHPPDP